MFLTAASTLVWLRWRIFVHRSFHGLGVANAIAAFVIGLSLLLVSLLIGLGFAVGFFTSTQVHNPALPGLLFGAAFGFIFGCVLILPFLHAEEQGGFDARRCLIFPLPLRHLYALAALSEMGTAPYVFAGPTLLVTAAASVLLPGHAAAARLGVVLIFMAMTAAWGNLLSTGTQRLLQNRRMREAVILVIALGVVSIGILPQVVAQNVQRLKGTQAASRAGTVAKAAASALPPVWASRAVTALKEGDWEKALAPTAGMIAFLLAGVGLGQAAFRRVVLDPTPGGRVAAPGPTTVPRAPERDAIPPLALSLGRRLPGETRAVWIKDLRYLFRSSVGRLSFFTVPLITLFMATVAGAKSFPPICGYTMNELMFLLISLYISLFVSNLANNLFRWDGPGTKAYFLSPVRLRFVLLGKNLAVGVYGFLLCGLCAGTCAAVGRLPRPAVAATGALCFAIALVLFSTLGNFLSVLFPKKNDITSWKQSAPSNLSVLAGLIALAAVMGITGTSVLVPGALHAAAWTPPLLLALLGLAGTGYAFSLEGASRLMEKRREDLLRTLRATD